jgi:hypothetical protein
VAPRLKVFVTSDGLTDYVVAVSSKAKALAAWGVRQDLFKEGRARETNDPALVAAAMAQPGEVVKRPAETRRALARLKPPKRAKAPATPKAAPKPKAPSKAALKKAADLEARLSALDTAHDAARAEFARARLELDRREQAEAAGHAARREKLVGVLSAARQALR